MKVGFAASARAIRRQVVDEAPLLLRRLLPEPVLFLERHLDPPVDDLQRLGQPAVANAAHARQHGPDLQPGGLEALQRVQPADPQAAVVFPIVQTVFLGLQNFCQIFETYTIEDGGGILVGRLADHACEFGKGFIV